MPMDFKVLAFLCCMAGFLLAGVLPAKVYAASLFEYTQGRFSFTGHVGLRNEDRQYNINSSKSETKSLRTQIQTNLKGFVWDPRFMVFNAGIGLMQQTIESGVGKSEPSTNQYSLYTTWFPKIRNPFILFLNHSTTEVSAYSAPTYHVTTENLGMRWGLQNRLFGLVRFTYDLRMATSSGQQVDRDQTDHRIKVDAKRRFRSGRRDGSDVSYGYRYDNKNDRSAGRRSGEHHLYIKDRTTFANKMYLTADASYFNRTDDTRGGSGSMQYLNASSRLNVDQRERLSYYYNLGINYADFDAGENRSISGGAGVRNDISDRWRTNASVTMIALSSTTDGSEDSVRSIATGGVGYRRPLGTYNLSSNYSLGYDSVLSGPSDGNIINHAFDIGVSQSAFSLWMDTINYSIGISDGGKRSSLSQSVIYRVVSNFSLRDSFRFTAEYRTLSSKNSRVDVSEKERETSNKRALMEWTHKFNVISSLNISINYAESDNTTDGENRDRQTLSGRMVYRTALFDMRNLRLIAKANYYDIQGDLGDSGERVTAELDLAYNIGRWRALFGYDYFSRKYQTQTYEEHRVTVEIKRLFGIRF